MLYFHNILNSFWSLKPDAADNYLPLVLSYLKGNPIEMPKNEKPLGIKIAGKNSVYANRYWNLTEDEIPKNSVVIIPIREVITKHDQYCGEYGMITKSNMLRLCYQNPNITGIVLDMETVGGECYAERLMKETIAARNKPVAAFVNDYCYSAGVGIATACDWITANSELAFFGSIGTMCSMYDYREYFKKEGVELKEWYATASKDKNSVMRDALNGKPEELIKQLDRFCESLLAGVEAGRGDKLKKDRKEWGTGKEYFAGEALEMGLIDEINSFENLIKNFF